MPKRFLGGVGVQGGLSAVGSGTITDIWAGTQAQYDAIGTKNPTTLYFVNDAAPPPQLTSATNLVGNPRAKASGGGTGEWQTVLAGTRTPPSGTPPTYRTGQPGYSHGTTTDVSITAPAGNSHSVNACRWSAWTSGLLTPIPDGAPVTIWAEAKRSAGGIMRVRIVPVDTAGVWIDADASTSADTTVTAGQATWVTHSFTKKSAHSRFVLELLAPSLAAGETLSVTNVAVGYGVDSFFDGASPSGGGVSYAWAGVPDASSSTRTVT